MKIVKKVFVNGCFDILHPGHVFFLKEAKKEGNLLIVGLNSDRSVKSLKGKMYRSFEERKFMLEACKFVDIVLSFDQTTAEAVVEFLRPEVYVTGDEYKGRSPEARLVRDYGGKVVFINRLGEYSTSLEAKRESV